MLLRLVLVLSIIPSVIWSCQRNGRHIIMAQERSASDIIQGLKNDFDMNVHFGLRKIGLNRNTSKKFLGY